MKRWAVMAVLLAALPACGASEAPLQAVANGGPQAGDARPAATLRGVTVETIASGLERPWSVALLPDGGFLVTERPGRLRHIGADGTVSEPLDGVPPVFAQGQGGLLDVVLAPDFAQSRRIWLTYAEPGPDGTAGTAAATAILGPDALADLRVVYRQRPKLTGGAHFGSRIAFDREGHVFISQGERFDKMRAQDLAMLQGKLVRLDVDGSIPADNPFVDRAGAQPEIYSYGHRNMQGLAVDPMTGVLWESEHGPRGGDELNLPEAGKNYGWPLISNGMDYATNRPYPETIGTDAPGMESPYHVWKQSPGLSAMAFLRDVPASPWNDSLFLGALADRNLIRLSLDGNKIVGEERLLQGLGERIRDVRTDAEGAVYVLTDSDDGRLLRVTPQR
jgi:glucose/arabinose dehydrogenase